MTGQNYADGHEWSTTWADSSRTCQQCLHHSMTSSTRTHRGHGTAASSSGEESEGLAFRSTHSDRVAAFYDATKQTIVSADVNSYGLGGVLLQSTMDSSSQSHTAHIPLLQQKRGMPRLRRSAWLWFGLVRSSSGSWWA